MKRSLLIIASIILILVVLALSIGGCSSGTTTTTTTSKSTTTTTTTKSTTTTTTTTTTSPTTTTTTTSPTTTGTTSTAKVFYISVSVDGKLLVYAKPVAYTTGMTIDKALKAAHAAYFSGGEGGYAAGIDPTFGVFLINKCWGVSAIPYIILNDAPVPGPTITTFDDVTPVAANDNIIICTYSTSNPTSVSLKATKSGTNVTVTATVWTFNSSTFTYIGAPLKNAKVVDSKGATLGTTDADGKITLTIPADGIVAIDGLAAINVNASAP